MVEAGKAGEGKNTVCYIIETRIDNLIKELNIDKKPDNWGIPQVRCLEYQDDGHDRAPVFFQHRSICLFESGCQQPEEKYDVGIPGSACYGRFHHNYSYNDG